MIDILPEVRTATMLDFGLASGFVIAKLEGLGLRVQSFEYFLLNFFLGNVMKIIINLWNFPVWGHMSTITSPTTRVSYSVTK